VFRQAGYASGCGYDKATASISGAHYRDLKAGVTKRIEDRGQNWDRQLQEAGYLVIQAV